MFLPEFYQLTSNPVFAKVAAPGFSYGENKMEKYTTILINRKRTYLLPDGQVIDGFEITADTGEELFVPIDQSMPVININLMKVV